MKFILTIAFSFALMAVNAQFSTFAFQVVSTWYTIDTLNLGDQSFIHDHVWISSKPWSTGGGFMSCAVYHPPGERCSWAIQYRKSICEKCLMHISETDEPPKKPDPIPQPEIVTYEKLLDLIRKE